MLHFILDSRGTPKVTFPLFSGNSRFPTPPHQKTTTRVIQPQQLYHVFCLLLRVFLLHKQNSLPISNLEIQRHHFFPPFTHGSAAKTKIMGDREKSQQFDRIICFEMKKTREQAKSFCGPGAVATKYLRAYQCGIDRII